MMAAKRDGEEQEIKERRRLVMRELKRAAARRKENERNKQ